MEELTPDDAVRSSVRPLPEVGPYPALDSFFDNALEELDRFFRRHSAA
jgi:hypothetical protein